MISALVICVVVLVASVDRLNANDDDSKLADAVNNFGIGYYKQQISNNQNTMVSGYGVALADTMMLTGARTDTEMELREKLGYSDAGLSNKQVGDSFHRILTKQRNHDPAYGLGVGNSLWTQSGFSVLSDFKNGLASNFFAFENEVDFSKSSTTNTINSWITNVTQNANNKLFGGFNINTEVAALINVLYFIGKFKILFDKNGQVNQPFTSSDGSSKSILMMKTENTLKYFYNQDLDAGLLEIPYNGNEVCMYFLLPRTASGITNLEKKLTLTTLKSSIAGLQSTNVSVTIPLLTSFTQVSAFSYSLFKTADYVNMDLSGIDGKIDLYQAQYGQYYRYSYGTPKLSPNNDSFDSQVDFNANHPFIYFFRHNPTDIILFMGRLVHA